jgi:hypothetical protein
MKGTLAAALTGLQGLGWDEAREKPIDRLTALGAMQNQRADDANNASLMRSLGQDVIAFKFAHRADAREDAIDKLAAQLANLRKIKLRPGLHRKVAAWALREHVVDMCPRCKGACEVPQFAGQDDGYQPMRPCPPAPEGCDGIGRRSPSDVERIAATGGQHAEAFEKAHELITRAEHLAIETAARMLERWR